MFIFQTQLLHFLNFLLQLLFFLFLFIANNKFLMLREFVIVGE